jgi:hypothetical protein
MIGAKGERVEICIYLPGGCVCASMDSLTIIHMATTAASITTTALHLRSWTCCKNHGHF